MARFSPDGASFVLSVGRRFTCYDVDTWEERWTCERGTHSKIAGRSAFTPDSAVVALDYIRDVIHLVDVATGALLAVLQSPDGAGFRDFRFNSDGTELVASLQRPALVTWKLEPIREMLRKMHLDWQVSGSPPEPADP